jgi:hypothetical protein
LTGSPGSGDEALPRTEEEFLRLCDLLSEKADAQTEDAPKPMPEHPTYDGPSDPGHFTPSRELEALYEEREQAKRRVGNARRDGSSKIYIEYVESELEKVEQEIAPIEEWERREKQEYEKRLREYREARKPYQRRLELWEAEAEKREKSRVAEAKQAEAVERMYRRVESVFKDRRVSADTQSPDSVPFEILPPGEWTDDHIRRYYQEVWRRAVSTGSSFRNASTKCSPSPGSAG